MNYARQFLGKKKTLRKGKTRDAGTHFLPVLRAVAVYLGPVPGPGTLTPAPFLPGPRPEQQLLASFGLSGRPPAPFPQACPCPHRPPPKHAILQHDTVPRGGVFLSAGG